MSDDWTDYAFTGLCDVLVHEYEFPPQRAEKLARTLIALSELEFGEEDD